MSEFSLQLPHSFSVLPGLNFCNTSTIIIQVILLLLFLFFLYYLLPIIYHFTSQKNWSLFLRIIWLEIVVALSWKNFNNVGFGLHHVKSLDKCLVIWFISSPSNVYALNPFSNLIYQRSFELLQLLHVILDFFNSSNRILELIFRQHQFLLSFLHDNLRLLSNFLKGGLFFLGKLALPIKQILLGRTRSLLLNIPINLLIIFFNRILHKFISSNKRIIVLTIKFIQSTI